METWRERLLQNIGIPGNQDTVSYILLGTAAENYAPDAATDAAARYLKGRQASDGHWWIQEPRNPLESSDIQVTAVSMRAIQVYAPKILRCSKTHVSHVLAGKVPGIPRLTHIAMGRRKLVRREWLEQWMEANRIKC
jgi:hypothetical protein